MEAKDTVMSKEQIIDIMPSGDSWEDGRELLWDYVSQGSLRNIATRQAEISFPLGKQEGRREVVEWIWSNATDVFKDYLQCSQKWQAYLKEWGIEESQESSTSPKE